MLGVELASYRVVSPIGEGGMGMVFRAEHVLLGRPAAVKMLRPELSTDTATVTRFFNEARSATSIRHPSIVEVYDFGFHADGRAYIVMELLQGESLAQRMRRGRMPAWRALQLGRQIAGALAAAHAAGIIHRDLKPDNVFLVPDPEVPGGERIKLLDFGVAKLVDTQPGAGHTTTGAIIGTPAYMAPEQCRGVRIDHRADLYSLGCILYEAMCASPPFLGEGAGDVIVAHIHEPPRSPRERAPEMSSAVERLVLRLLAKAPDDRPATASEVIRLIDATGATTTGVSGPMPVAGAPLASPSQTITTLSGASIATPARTAARGPTRRWPYVAALGVVLVAGGTAVALMGGSEPATAVRAGPVAAPVALAAAVAAPAPAPAVPTTISLDVASTPPGAELLVDGVAVGVTPYRGALPRREREVALTLRLRGYRDLRITAPGTGAIARTVELEAMPRPAPPRQAKQRAPHPVDRDRGVNPF